MSHLFETQGSPTPLAWFAHQLPDWLLRLGTVGVLVSQTVLPLLYFAPVRSLRLGAFYLQVCVCVCAQVFIYTHVSVIVTA